MNLSKLDHWHQTKQGFLAFGLFELAIAYLLGSLAVDDGSLIVYGLAFVLFFGAVNNLFKFTRDTKAKAKK